MERDREEQHAQMRGAALAEHVYVEPDQESQDRHVLVHGRRVGKITWDAEGDQWETYYAKPEGEYVFVGWADAEPEDPERIDRVFGGDVAYALANAAHPMSEDLL